MGGWVLGCHRSGTSLLCHILREASRSNHQHVLGDDIARGHDNPLGHAESAALMGVNEEVLALAGAAWDRPFLVRPHWESAEAMEWLRRLDQRLSAHIANHRWIDKDPRLCLTRDALAHTLLEDMPSIAILRHPLEVAQSLFQRDGFSLQKSTAIWLVYNQHLFNSTSRPPLATVLLQDFGDPDKQPILAAKMDAFLGEALDYDSTKKYGTEALLSRHFHNRLLRSRHAGVASQDNDLSTRLDHLWDEIRADVEKREGSRLDRLFRAAVQEFETIILREVAPPLPGLSQQSLQKELVLVHEELTATCQALRNAQEESRIALGECDKLRQSTAWRLTAPARKALDAIKDLFRK